MNEPQLLPLSEAARRIGRSVDTLRRWIAQGRLRAQRLPDINGSLYVLASDLGLAVEETKEQKVERRKAKRQAKADREAEQVLREMGVIQ